MAAPFHMSSRKVWRFCLLHSLTNIWPVVFFSLGLPRSVYWYSTAAVICISLMTSDAECFFTCLLSTCISSFSKVSFPIFCHFLNWFFVLLLNYKHFKFIWDASHIHIYYEKLYFNKFDKWWKMGIFLFYLLLFLKCIYFSLKDNCFTILCWFLPDINMSQPQVYICLLPLKPPSHLPPHKMSIFL